MKLSDGAVTHDMKGRNGDRGWEGKSSVGFKRSRLKRKKEEKKSFLQGMFPSLCSLNWVIFDVRRGWFFTSSNSRIPSTRTYKKYQGLQRLVDWLVFDR